MACLNDDERTEAERDDRQQVAIHDSAIASSTTSCICNGATKAAICNATDKTRTCASAVPHPVIFDHSIDSFIGTRAETGSKRFGASQFEDDAGKVLGEFLRRERPHSDRRVVDDDALASNAFQDDEVVEIPMQRWPACGSCSSAESSTRRARVENPS